jgi:hypothetical protein
MQERRQDAEMKTFPGQPLVPLIRAMLTYLLGQNDRKCQDKLF